MLIARDGDLPVILTGSNVRAALMLTSKNRGALLPGKITVGLRHEMHPASPGLRHPP